MRVLAYGGRKFRDTTLLHNVMMRLHIWKPITLLIEGEQVGADRMARDWAQMMGIEVLPFYADWKTFGPRAGNMRNAKMLREGKPEFAIGFPGGPGSSDMTLRLKQAQVLGIFAYRDKEGSIAWKKLLAR